MKIKPVLLLITLLLRAANALAEPIRLVVLDPGHGHATFMQGQMYEGVDPTVFVYAPEGRDVENYVEAIERYNRRSNNPTHWKLIVYRGEDYLNKLLLERPGNTVIISGNNLKKPGYIQKCLKAGYHVLADKPMAITSFRRLKKSFSIAERKQVLLFDPMDLRYDVNSMLQREIAGDRELFGSLQTGSIDDPALVQANLHHYLKFSGGEPLTRPAWFFDVKQQGHGITDVSTHLVDLNQWMAFPERSIDYKKDIRVMSSREWENSLRLEEFELVTKEKAYPDYLKRYVRDSVLSVRSNGEFNYMIRGVHAKVTVIWRFREPAGSGDTRYSLMKGTRAITELRQTESEGFRPKLFIRPAGQDTVGFGGRLEQAVQRLSVLYPGTTVIRRGSEWEIKAGQTARNNAALNAIMYLNNRRMPAWEVPNMLTKYYITLGALKKAN